MAEDVLCLERRERLAILTLNRPDRLNALSIELREALVHACQELQDDDDIWAIEQHLARLRYIADNAARLLRD